MANKTIDELTTAGALTGAELLHIVQGGSSRKVSLDQIKNALAGLNVGQGLAAPFRGALLGRTSELADFTYPLLVPWQTADYDTDGFWNAGQSTRFTVPAGVSKVRVSGQVVVTVAATAHSMYCSILKNGSSDYRGSPITHVRQSASGFFNNEYLIPAGAAIPVVAGDYFELRINGSGVAVSMNDIVLSARNWFSIEVVEAAA